MKYLAVMLIPFALCACNEIEQSKSDSSYNYSYDFAENGCSTGRLTFTSATQLCRCLQDEAYNNFCARERREEAFYNLCAGEFSSSVCEY